MRNGVRPSIPIVVHAGADIKSYLAQGMAAIEATEFPCPVCDDSLNGNGWGKRVAKRHSVGYEPPERIPVRRLHCPSCHAAGRHPRNFTVLPSFLAPRKHFLQAVRERVFRLHWETGVSLAVLEERLWVDLPLLRWWMARTAGALAAAVPALAAELGRLGGELPRETPAVAAATPWATWCYLALALRAHLGAVAAVSWAASATVLEWLTVYACTRRNPWWAP